MSQNSLYVKAADRTAGGKKVWRPFLLNLSLVIILFIMGIFIGFVFRTNRIIEKQQVSTARAYFKNIVLTRRWNAGYGGVYVKKTKGVESNPYLENPDITTADGQVFTKKNPALMTREISEYAFEGGDFRYHITSLTPLNPGNKPDDFESAALARFEVENIPEVYTTVEENGKYMFRYMAPLKTEKACLACHAKQGYKLGDIRGGISVTFDVSDLRREMARNKITLIALSICTILLLLLVVFFMVSRLASQLTRAYQTIEALLVMDELTQVFNRRYFFPRLGDKIARARRYGKPLSLLFMDIDHFKRINDGYGHPVGDKVLKILAGLLRENTRQVDVVARYGGEEFAVLLPEVGESGAMAVAEKLREVIAGEIFDADGESFGITVSFGIASLDMLEKEILEQGAPVDGPPEEAPSGQIIKLADDALYEAKAGGRNRSVTAGRAKQA